jgi:hypothetical protein
LREKRDAAIEALRDKYGARLSKLEDRTRRAQQKLEREQSQASAQTTSALLTVGSTLLKTLFGGRRSSAATTARTLGRADKERKDVAHAEADLQALRKQAEAMNQELENEILELRKELDPQAVEVEAVRVRPRKSDLSVEDMALVWCP